MRNNVIRNNKGFSLVELIVVIAIMAILAAVAVVSYSIYIEKANEASDQQYLDNVDYIAQLLATEQQLGKVEVAYQDNIIDEPSDIVLVGKDPAGEENVYYTYETHPDLLQELYDAVGNWEFIVLKPVCDHKNCTVVLDTATCQKAGTRTRSCGLVEESPQKDHDLKRKPGPSGNVVIEYCGYNCGYNQIVDGEVVNPEEYPKS